MKLLYKIILPTTLVVLSGCQAKLKVSATSKEDGRSGSSFKVTGRAPLVVKSGDKLSLTGEGFKPGMSLALAGNAVGNVEVSDAQNASWTAPEGMSGGVVSLTATQDGATQDISIIYQPGDGSIPVITETAAEVCSPEQFYDAQGTLQTGSKNCAAPADQGIWNAEDAPFPGSGYFIGATLPPVASVCSSGKIGGEDGTATCQTGTPTGTNPTAGEILSGKSAWSSAGSVINGAMANQSGAWSLTSAWPGTGYFDTAPTFPDNKVCDDTSFLGTAGTADCSGGGGGSFQSHMKSTAHRTVDRDQVSLATEVSTGLSGDYRRVPNIRTDDDGYAASSPVVKQTRPTSNCGTSGTIEERIANCNITWSGKANGNAGEGDWKLVTRIDTPAVYEVWRDERTGLIWSDRVGDSTSTIDPDTNDFTANWCQASGNAQADDPNNYCNNATYQNQETPESWCGDEARGAPMKGNIGSTQNITWRLPSIYDWNIANANGILFVLPNPSYYFWSASVVSYDRSNALQFGSSDFGLGGVYYRLRDFGGAVRCVGAR